MTYAWLDNNSDDVEHVAQRLDEAGLTIRRDKWDLKAGAPLWKQIDVAITDPKKSDAWLIYATQNSLASKKCHEELYYALHRALETRGEDFPILALFPSQVDESLIPAAIQIRLHVSTEDPDWVQRIVAGAKGQTPSVSRPRVEEYEVVRHENAPTGDPYVMEMRPRAGTWSPFFCAVPIAEKGRLRPRITYGPRGIVPQVFAIVAYPDQVSTDGLWWVMAADNVASPTQSYFLHCAATPSEVRFGQANSGRYHFIKAMP